MLTESDQAQALAPAWSDSEKLDRQCHRWRVTGSLARTGQYVAQSGGQRTYRKEIDCILERRDSSGSRCRTVAANPTKLRPRELDHRTMDRLTGRFESEVGSGGGPREPAAMRGVNPVASGSGLTARRHSEERVGVESGLQASRCRGDGCGAAVVLRRAATPGMAWRTIRAGFEAVARHIIDHEIQIERGRKFSPRARHHEDARCAKPWRSSHR